MMKSQRPAVVFTIIFTLAVAIYSVLHSKTVSEQPTVGDDSLAGALHANPNFIFKFSEVGYELSHLSHDQAPAKPRGFQEDEGIPNLVYFSEDGKRIPWSLQTRQSALPYAIFQGLLTHLEPVAAVLFHQRLTSLLVILLTGIFLFRAAGLAAAGAGMLLLAIDPVEILSFGPTISEPWLKIITLTAMILFLVPRRWTWLAAGFFTAFGFFLQINFLWYASIIAVVALRHAGPLKTAISYSALGFTVGIIPTFMSLNWSELFSELDNHAFYLGDGTPVLHKPLKDLINLIIDKKDFYAGFFDSSQVLGQRGWAFHLISPSFFGILALIGFLIWLHPQIKRRLSANEIRWCVTLNIALLVFFFAMWASTTTTLLHMQYLIGVNVLVIGILAIVGGALLRLQRLGIALFALFMVLPQIGLSYEWVRKYRQHGPMPLINANLQLEVTKRLIETQPPPPLYAISYGDTATYEFLSREQLWPTHAARLVENTQRFPNLIQLLKFLSSGSMVITLNDQFSAWYLGWGPIDPEKVRREAPAQGVRITHDEIISPREGQQVWIFSFGLEPDNSAR